MSRTTPARARHFYAVIAGSTVIGLLLNYLGINPVRALFWTAVLNGLVSPPLLVVTDPSVVAPRVDGVILNIRLTNNDRPHAERAREILTTLGANIIGVVVNDAEHRTTVGTYGYGYGNSDGYHEKNGDEIANNGSPEQALHDQSAKK